MNCRICGYWYSEHDGQSNICGHCGGNRNGLSPTRLMKISKAMAAAAVILPVIFYVIEWHGTLFTLQKLFGTLSPEELEGRSGAWDFGGLFLEETLLSWIFAVIGIIRSRKCSFGLFLLSAVIMFPAAFFGVFEHEYIIYTLSFLLYISAAVTAMADKKKQIKEFQNLRR